MEMLQGQQAEGDVYVRDLLQWAQNLQGEQAQHQYQILHFVQDMVSRARNEIGEILNKTPCHLSRRVCTHCKIS